MTNIQHGKLITTKVFYGGEVITVKEQYEESVFTTQDTILKEIIDALSLVTKGQTTKLEMCVQINKKNQIKLNKTWQA